MCIRDRGGGAVRPGNGSHAISRFPLLRRGPQLPLRFCAGVLPSGGWAGPVLSLLFWGISEEEGYEAYFRTIPANLAAFPDFHSYAHLDYIVRYGPRRNEAYSFEKYREVLVPALRALIDAGKALEVNTGGCKYGLGQPNPQTDVLRAYRAMGGELITVGSDAHRPEHVAYDFPRLAELLRGIGFRYYAVFRGGKPDMRRL